MSNINALLYLAKKYGVDQSVIDDILKSKQIKVPVVDRNGEEICEANWALSKCNAAYNNREAVDVRMLVKALPKITSTQVLKKFHDQVEDMNLEYRELEPIYVRFVQIAKTFQVSFPFFEKIHQECENYDELLNQQLQLATNIHAIDAVGKIGVQYFNNLNAKTADNPESEDFEPERYLVKWNATIVNRILNISRTYKEAAVLLPYIINEGKFVDGMYATAVAVFEKMLPLLSNSKQAEEFVNVFPIEKNLKAWMITNALNRI